MSKRFMVQNTSLNVIRYVENILEDNPVFDAKSILAIDTSHEKRLKYWSDELCQRAPQIFDIVISLGGDGTVLYSSLLFQRVVPPVLSFGLGSLGFLTKFNFDDHEASLDVVLNQGFNVNLRLRFEATVMRKKHEGDCKGKDLVDELIGDGAQKQTHKPNGSHHILNEVVIDRGPNGSKSVMIVCIVSPY